jgi:transcription antitermination factor NusG
VERPLFPSYVFARVRASELPQVLNTRGLVTILRAGGALAVVPDEEIDNVRRFAGAVTDHRIIPEREALVEAGDRVRVLTVDLDGASLQVTGAGGPQTQATHPRIDTPGEALAGVRSSAA